MLLLIYNFNAVVREQATVQGTSMTDFIITYNRKQALIFNVILKFTDVFYFSFASVSFMLQDRAVEPLCGFCEWASVNISLFSLIDLNS